MPYPTLLGSDPRCLYYMFNYKSGNGNPQEYSLSQLFQLDYIAK